MTIEIKGHVHALEKAGPTKIRVTLQLDANHLPDTYGGLVTLLAKTAEVAAYKIGMPVIVQVRPG